MYICTTKTTKGLYKFMPGAVRVEHPALSPSQRFVNLSFLAVSAARRAHSLHRRSLSSLSCSGFGALLEVFRISMFSTIALNWGILNNCLGLHVVLDHAHIVCDSIQQNMELKVINWQAIASFNDTKIYQTYTYWFYRQFPNINGFPGFLEWSCMHKQAIPSCFSPPTWPE